MHSKGRYTISTGSVILGKLVMSLQNYKGFSIILQKIFGAIQRITKVRIFLIPPSITFFNRKF